MPDKKNSSTDRSVESAIYVTHQKKTVLSQQVSEQAELIEELTARLRQKEKELAAHNGHSRLIEEMAQKLQSTEQTMAITSELEQSSEREINKLTARIQQQEQELTSADEQAELISELTANLHEVEIELASASIDNRRIMAQNITKTHMMAGMALGLLPTPLIDIAGLAGTQLNLLRSLCKHYGVDFDDKTGKAVLTSLISGSLPVMAVVGLSSFAKLIPGIGTIGGGISITVLSGSIIYATGQVFIRHFEAGGGFQNFDSKHWHPFFKEQFEKGKIKVKSKLDRQKMETDAASGNEESGS